KCAIFLARAAGFRRVRDEAASLRTASAFDKPGMETFRGGVGVADAFEDGEFFRHAGLLAFGSVDSPLEQIAGRSNLFGGSTPRAKPCDICVQYAAGAFELLCFHRGLESLSMIR